MANSVLADEILEVLERIDELGTAMAEAEQKLVKAKEELAKSSPAGRRAARGPAGR